MPVHALYKKFKIIAASSIFSYIYTSNVLENCMLIGAIIELVLIVLSAAKIFFMNASQLDTLSPS